MYCRFSILHLFSNSLTSQFVKFLLLKLLCIAFPFTHRILSAFSHFILTFFFLFCNHTFGAQFLTLFGPFYFYSLPAQAIHDFCVSIFSFWLFALFYLFIFFYILYSLTCFYVPIQSTIQLLVFLCSKCVLDVWLSIRFVCVCLNYYKVTIKVKWRQWET